MAVEQHSDIFAASDVIQTCEYCNKPITDVVLAAVGKTWHVDHFTCAKCGQPIRESGFFVVDGRPYCALDYKTRYANKCSACGEPIEKMIYKALDKHWHPECVVCKKCRKPIASKEFVEYRGLAFCMNCSRRFVEHRNY